MSPPLPRDTAPCLAISDVLARIGDKWSVLVITSLGAETLRFSELERKIGNVSKKMLTSTLRQLERDGFVSRRVSPSRPPRVDYALTPLGTELLGPLCALAQWAGANHERIEAARAAFDAEENGNVETAGAAHAG